MRKYEDLKNIRVNALPPRCYYIPENEGCKINLNGTWGFNYYEKEEEFTAVLFTFQFKKALKEITEV